MIKKDSFLPIIGLEIHIELKTSSKMFCRCSAHHFGRPPNTQVCPICLGLPGSLPVPNRKAIEGTVLAGLALNCQIPFFSKFDRKNYFYPDLPKGYQISQYDLPLAINGELKSKVKSQKSKVRIRRVHLEEDTAKMIHRGKYTLIDFNRSGVPLMEVVTEPDIHSAKKAKEFLKKLTQVIRFLGISDCDMEKGSMRLEANISVGRHKATKLPGYKVEIKNLNSFRFVEKAIDYEIGRQTRLYKSGKTPIQETRGWNETKQVTFPQRIKEEAQDYRYFPEPDLPPIRWRNGEMEKLRNLLPELPEKKLARFVKDYKLSEYNAKILTETWQAADYFEEAVKLGKDKLNPLQIANVIINKKVNIAKSSPTQLVKILLKKQKITKLPDEELKKIIEEVLKENQKAVQDYLKGKTNAIQFLVGQVMAKTKGQANAKEVRKIITQGVNRVSP